jgi:hypothetical protein
MSAADSELQFKAVGSSTVAMAFRHGLEVRRWEVGGSSWYFVSHLGNSWYLTVQGCFRSSRHRTLPCHSSQFLANRQLHCHDTVVQRGTSSVRPPTPSVLPCTSRARRHEHDRSSKVLATSSHRPVWNDNHTGVASLLTFNCRAAIARPCGGSTPKPNPKKKRKKVQFVQSSLKICIASC